MSHVWRWAAMALIGCVIAGPALAGHNIEEPTAAEISAAQAHLDELRQRYTENHPDVIAARARLRNLKNGILRSAHAVILVRVVKPNSVHSDHATVLVLRSWKGPFSAGQVLHVGGRKGAGTPWQHLFRARDIEVLLATDSTKAPIVSSPGRAWLAAESGDLMQALDQQARQAEMVKTER